MTLNPVSSLIQNPLNNNSPKSSSFARINGHKCRNRNSSLDLTKMWNTFSFKENNQREVNTLKKNDQNSQSKAINLSWKYKKSIN